MPWALLGEEKCNQAEGRCLSSPVSQQFGVVVFLILDPRQEGQEDWLEGADFNSLGRHAEAENKTFQNQDRTGLSVKNRTAVWSKHKEETFPG